MIRGFEYFLMVAGTARGADTVALLSLRSSNRFFDFNVLDMLAKPVIWKKISLI